MCPWPSIRFHGPSSKFLDLPPSLSGPNRAMQPRCAMRFGSHIPKSLAMRKSFFFFFFASDAKTHSEDSLDLKSQENARKKNLRKSCDVGLRCKKSGCFLRSSDAKWLRFGLPLRFGLRREHLRCQIASDVGRTMRTTKCPQLPYHPCKNGMHSTCFCSRIGHTRTLG